MTSLGPDGLLAVELTIGDWQAVMQMIDRIGGRLPENEKAACLVLALQLQTSVREAMFAAGQKPDRCEKWQN